MEQDREVVWEEFGQVVKAPHISGQPPSVEEMQMRYGEVIALVEEAETGDLQGHSWDHVARDPLLWEFRLQFVNGNEDMQIRGYFHEPGHRPRQTVVAKLHVKDCSPTDSAEIKRLQDIHIDEAGARVRDCAEDDWGLDRCPRRFTRR